MRANRSTIPGGGALSRQVGPRLFLFVVALLAAASPSAGQTLDEARQLHMEGRFEEALIAYRGFLDSPEGSDPASAAAASNNSCVIRMNLGQHAAALEDCREALRQRLLGDDQRRLARTLNNLGLALQNVGEFTESAERYREALAINREIGETAAAAQNLANLSSLAIREARYDLALARIEETMALASEHEGEAWAKTQTQVALMNQGVVLEKLGAPREALESYRRVLADEGEIDTGLRALLNTNMGVMYRNLGDPVKALELFEQAARSYEEIGDSSGLSNVHLNMALARHLNLGELELAEADYRRALELAESGGDRPEAIQDLFYLGRLLLDREDWTEAEEVFERALAVSEESGSHEGLWSALAGLGRVAAARGDLPLAIDHFERAMAEIEGVRDYLEPGDYRAGFFGDKRFVYAAAVQTLAAMANAEPSGGHAERALHVVQRAKARELLDALGPDGQAGEPLPASELGSAPSGELWLEFFVAEPDLFAWRIDSDGLELRNLGAAAGILSDVAELHAALSQGQRPPDQLLQTLGSTLLRQGLPATVRSLRVAPDAGLRYLPFELLPVPGTTSELLLDRVDVSYLPSISSVALLAGRTAISDLPVLGFGSPVLPDSQGSARPASLLASRFAFQPLPATEGELDTLGDWLGGETEIFRGVQATEESFRNATAGGARVVHLATHTVIDERPGHGSAILLSPDGTDDGLLSPPEIAALDLRADLAVLAACQTALAEGGTTNSLTTLTGAFLAAGSAGVVATLWEVGDQAAAAFMSQFYWQLGRGLAPAEALRQAKLTMREDAEWGKSHLWAGYILVGDPPPVASPRPVVPAWAWVLGALLVVALWLWRRKATTSS
jgi:CHAT domain-containing protein/Tfp pilus assembly protein PilF